MPGNSSYTTIISTTLQNFSNKIMDNVTTNTTLTRYLKAAGNIKVVSGGRKFVHQLLYAKNSSFAARASLDTISLPVTDSISASEWDIKVLSGSVVLPELDIAMNAGSKEKLLDYADAKRMEAEVSMTELLSDQIWNTSVGANDMDSLYTIVSSTASTETVASACGGIAGSTNSFWRNYVYATTVGSWNSLSGGASIGLNALDISLQGATFGNQGPKLIVGTSAIFTLYMLGLTANTRYTSLEKGDAGFKQLLYGGIPFVADADCPSNKLYGIDTDNLKLQVLAQGNFGQSPFKWSQDQLSQSALMYLFANLTCGSRRTNFVMTSITG